MDTQCLFSEVELFTLISRFEAFNIDSSQTQVPVHQFILFKFSITYVKSDSLQIKTVISSINISLFEVNKLFCLKFTSF
jgi:hypothetical protein